MSSIHVPRAPSPAHRRWRAALLAALAAIASGSAGSAEDTASFDAKLRAQIEGRLAQSGGSALGERLAERDELVRFYQGRGGNPAWLEGQNLREPLARDLLGALRDADQHGLPPDAYHAGALDRALSRPAGRDPDHLASLDILLSDAFLHLARQLAQGAVDPRSLHAGFQRASEPALDPVRVLDAALEAGAIADALARCAPPHREYQALVDELARLRGAPSRDKSTSAHVNQLRASLERWRWMPRDLGKRHVRVNAASFGLEAFDGGELRVAMRVVVGEKDWKTPLAHGEISHLELNPDWRIPRSIATREMLPAARRDPGYFRAKGIQVLTGDGEDSPRQLDATRIDWKRVDAEEFPYQLRQPPGPHNPLGRIKFAFDNPFGVYLHGTPGDLAFTRGLRALSHGCVRLEDEIALAKFALAPDPSWTEQRLIETLRNAWEYRLPLPEPLPVYLLYFTAVVDRGGKVTYSPDPYGWDRDLLAALDSNARSKTARAAPTHGVITTGVPTRLRAARKSMSSSVRPTHP